MQSALFPVCSILVHGFDTVCAAFFMSLKPQALMISFCLSCEWIAGHPLSSSLGALSLTVVVLTCLDVASLSLIGECAALGGNTGCQVAIYLCWICGMYQMP